MENLQRERKLFGLELLYFFLLAFSRFFDHKLQKHPVPFSFLEQYGAAVGLTILYLLLLFALAAAALRLGRKIAARQGSCQEECRLRERELCWLLIFLSVFAVPFFLHRDYFGTSDEAFWCIVLAALLFLMLKKAVKKPSSSVLILIAGTFTALAVILGFFVPDVQDLLSVRQFAVMVLFLSPYGYWGLGFFRGLLAAAGKKDRQRYLLCAACGACPAILWMAAGDYSRAVFYGFSGIILAALYLTAAGDTLFSAHVRSAKNAIRSVLPIPAVFVFYPLIFITFWMMGWESIPAEEILKLQ